MMTTLLKAGADRGALDSRLHSAHYYLGTILAIYFIWRYLYLCNYFADHPGEAELPEIDSPRPVGKSNDEGKIPYK